MKIMEVTKARPSFSFRLWTEDVQNNLSENSIIIAHC